MSGGGTIGDFMSMGYLPAQHHDGDYDSSCRGVMFMARRIQSTDRFEAPEIEANTTGDWLGLNLWPREGSKREISGWSGSWASVVSAAGTAQPGVPGKTITQSEKGETKFYVHPNHGELKPDFRFQAKEPSHWPLWHSNMPIGWPGTLNTGTDEFVQEEIFSPSFVGLVASDRGSSEYSTKVVDLSGERVDEDNYAPLHTLMAVENIVSGSNWDNVSLSPGRYLALQFGTRGGRQNGGEVMSSGLARIHSNDGSNHVCTLSASAGGPLTHSFERHIIGTLADGRPVEPAALSTGAMWTRDAYSTTQTPALSPASDDGSLTGPLQFGGILDRDYINLAPAYILYDPRSTYRFGGKVRRGAWHVWTESHLIADAIILAHNAVWGGEDAIKPPLPGGGTRTRRRPHPPQPKDTDPAGHPLTAPGGIGGMNAEAGRDALGRAHAGQGGGFSFGMPKSSRRGRGTGRSPFGGWGIPNGGGGGPDGPSRHTKHNRPGGPRKSAGERRRAREKRWKEAQDKRTKERMDKLDDDHPVKRSWLKRKAREKAREEARRDKARRRKEKADEKRRRKALDKFKKRKERERKREERRKKREQNRNGYFYSGPKPKDKMRGSIGGGTGGLTHGLSLGGSGQEQWDPLVGVTPRQELTSPKTINVVSGLGIRSDIWAAGRDALAVGRINAEVAQAARRAPKVARIVGFASGGGGNEWSYSDGNNEMADGSVIMLPSGYDFGRMVRDETQDANVATNTVSQIMPAGLTDMFFGELDPRTGKGKSGVGLMGDGIGGLDFTLYGASGDPIPSVGINMGEGGITLTGKVTGNGYWDPTGLGLTPQTSDPSGGSDYDIWVRNSDKALIYSQAGTDNVVTLGGGGGAGQLLSKTTGVDLTTVAATSLYTVPSGETAVVTRVVIVPTTATTVTAAPVAGIGIAAGESDIIAPITLTGLTATGIAYGVDADSLAATGAAASVVKIGVDTGATATALTADVYLFGYLQSGVSGVSTGTSSPLTTKGDLWGYSTADARIPVGANSSVLMADSTAALGVKWADQGKLRQSIASWAHGVTTITSAIPYDSTIPLWTEGTALLSVGPFTPRDANNWLVFRFTGDFGTSTANAVVIGALFDGSAGTCRFTQASDNASSVHHLSFEYWIQVSSTTQGSAAQTWYLRLGANVGNCYTNGDATGSPMIGTSPTYSEHRMTLSVQEVTL